jgi:voltage-gated potassium channel
MLTFLYTLGRFIQAIWRGLRDPEFRSLLILVIITLVTGALFYAKVEGWNLLDAVYFCFVTLTTIGYGDLAPTKPISKIFTILYIIVGIGILLGFINMVARSALARNKPKDMTTHKKSDDNTQNRS